MEEFQIIAVLWLVHAVLAAALRAALAARVPDRVCAASMLAGLCVLAAGVYFVVPPFPE